MTPTSTRQADVAVVGAGIVGLAHALAAARQGLRVVLFERTERAVGASIRNFGLVWPIGQPAGPLRRRALRSREIWLEAARAVGLWCQPSGSLHLAYHDDEVDVLLEFLETTPEARDTCGLLSPEQVAQHSPAARPDKLRYALWSSTELNVDPRQALRALPAWLKERWGVQVRWNAGVIGVSMPWIETLAERWHVGRVVVCGGNDFETLYPREYAASGIVRCQLQMQRTVPQPAGWRLGPSLCAGLTLLHYASFAHCESLAPLRRRIEHVYPFELANNIHVLLSQTALGELTIGDNHVYGLTHEPWSEEAVDAAILGYLQRFATAPNMTIAERWQGYYPLVRGTSELLLEPEPGVTIVNGLGGAGMTLSFGLAEEVVARW